MKLSDLRLDVDDLYEELRERLQSQSSFQSEEQGETVKLILELMAALGAMLNYRIAAAAMNAFLPTAFSPHGIWSLALSTGGASPHRKRSASLTGSITADSALNLTVPAFSRWSGRNLSWYNREAVVVNAGRAVDITLHQGTPHRQDFTNTGQTPYFRLFIGDTFSVDERLSSTHPSTIRVEVDGQVWTQVPDSFVTLTEESQGNVWLERTEPDGRVSINFGNGIVGNIPEAVSVRYALTQGAAGNSSLRGDPIVLITSADGGAAPAGVRLTVETEATGGQDEASLEEIQLTAPRLTASNHRAVRREDYEAHLLSQPEVKFASVWGEREEEELRGRSSVEFMNTVFLSVARDGIRNRELILPAAQIGPDGEWPKAVSRTSPAALNPAEGILAHPSVVRGSVEIRGHSPLSSRFRRSPTVPTTPGRTETDPEGWSETLPTGSGPLYEVWALISGESHSFWTQRTFDFRIASPVMRDGGTPGEGETAQVHGFRGSPLPSWQVGRDLYTGSVPGISLLSWEVGDSDSEDNNDRIRIRFASDFTFADGSTNLAALELQTPTGAFPNIIQEDAGTAPTRWNFNEALQFRPATFSGGGGSGATGRAAVNSEGGVVFIVVDDPGSGYATAPTVTVTGGTTAPTTEAALGTGDSAGQVASVSVSAPGSGFRGATAHDDFCWDLPSNPFAGDPTPTGWFQARFLFRGWSSPRLRANGVPFLLREAGEAGTRFVVNSRETVHSPSLERGYGKINTAPDEGFLTLDHRNESLLNHDGGISSIIVTNPGSGYDSAPSVSFSGGGSGATATASRTGDAVSSISVTTGGSGYLFPPAVTITRASGDTTGSGAEATAVLTGGVVTSINVPSGGSGYTGDPEVEIAGGSGATARASMSEGSITAITVTAPGSGYTSPPDVSIGPPTGSGPIQSLADAVLLVGVVRPASHTEYSTWLGDSSKKAIRAFRVRGMTGEDGEFFYPSNLQYSTDGGTTFLRALTVRELLPGEWSSWIDLGTPGAVSSLSVVDPGSGYASPPAAAPTVTFSGGGGSGATASAQHDSSGRITGLTLTDPGSGYTSAPTITIADPPSGTTATATASLRGVSTSSSFANRLVIRVLDSRTRGDAGTFRGRGEVGDPISRVELLLDDDAVGTVGYEEARSPHHVALLSPGLLDREISSSSGNEPTLHYLGNNFVLSQRNRILEVVNRLRNFTSRVSMMDPVARPVDVELDVLYRTDAVPATLESNVRAQVRNLFQTRFFRLGAVLALSDLYQTVTALPEVDHCLVRRPADNIRAGRNQFISLRELTVRLRASDRV